MKPKQSWAERHGWRGWSDVPVLLILLSTFALCMTPALIVIYINVKRLGWL